MALLLRTKQNLVSAVKLYDVLDQGTSFNPGKDECGVYVLDPSFDSMLFGRCDDTVDIKLRYNLTEPMFHEGPVLFYDVLYFVSNRLGKDSNSKILGGTNKPKLHQFIKIPKFRSREQ